MREAIEQLKETAALLREAEAAPSFKHCSPFVASRVYLAHASVKLAEARLHILMAKEEETCEKS